MTWKPKKKPIESSTFDELWEKYGTWITGAVVVVLAAVLAGMLINRYVEGKQKKGQEELEKIDPGAAGTEMQLRKLESEYGDSPLTLRIRLKLAQAMYQNGDYAGAEQVLDKLHGEKSLMALERAEVDLQRAYVAQERGDTDEALRRYEVVEKEGLYASEAKRLIALLDEAKKEPKPVETPEVPKK